MKPIDFVLLVPLLFGIYDGYKKGFLLVLVGLFAYVIGIIGAFKLTQIGIDFLIIYFPHMPKLLPFISFVLIFLLISSGIYILGLIAKKALNFSIFAGTLDNIMGAAIGLLQWIFMLSIVIWLIKQADFAMLKTYFEGSLVFSYLEPLAPKIVEKLTLILPFGDHLFQSINDIFKNL